MPIRYDADRSRHPWNFISLAMFLFDLAVHNHFWNFHWATFRLLITRCIFFWSSAESIVLLSAYHLARIFLGIWITLASANLAILRQCQLYFLTGYLREIEVIILRKRVENISWFFSIFFPFQNCTRECLLLLLFLSFISSLWRHFWRSRFFIFLWGRATWSLRWISNFYDYFPSLLVVRPIRGTSTKSQVLLGGCINLRDWS